MHFSASAKYKNFPLTTPTSKFFYVFCVVNTQFYVLIHDFYVQWSQTHAC